MSAVDTAFCNSRYMKSEGITLKEMDIQFIPVEQKTCVLRVYPSLLQQALFTLYWLPVFGVAHPNSWVGFITVIKFNYAGPGAREIAK